MKEVRKIYDKAFKEKAVQLSYDRTNVSELARELHQVMQKETGLLTSHSNTKVLESYYIDPQILSVVERGAVEIKIFGQNSSL
ncbi:transposase [Flavobacterium hiemivividum]|uniref:Transposase n=1 Tax=Flavobacterium hiemivividum TaxID=2541734 RepID=A0A4R5CS92_9FLAO|nr:transposase [Flavobacterium hiemivividum]TDE03146.1 transposase [Flavobacterium hiemivividum]